MHALLYKQITDNNNQELRHDVNGIKIANFKKVNNVRTTTEMAISSFKANKFSALYRFEVTLLNRNALQIETNDKIEIDGYKGLVSFVEIAPNQTGRNNKTIFVGLV